MSVAQTLLASASNGWAAGEPDVAQGVLRKLNQALCAYIEIVDTKQNAIFFLADIGKIRLRGAGDTACLLVSGHSSNTAPDIARFWESVSGPEQLVVVFALSNSAYASARATIPQGFACLFGPSEVANLIESSDALGDLKTALRKQIPLRRLIPFQNKHAVRGNMFYGRKNELSELVEQDTTNFAIAGQGRIGKSSLLEEYRTYVKKKDSRRTVQQYVDFYTCQPKNEAEIAQFLARAIEGGDTTRTRKMTAAALEPFLRYHVHRQNRKYDFIFDEVDAVCGTKTFMTLFHLAKKKDGPIARIILAGKRELLRQTSLSDSPLAEHVSLMRLEPLDEKSARKLLNEPLADMGLTFQNERATVDRILYLSGRLPQLIQYFGMRLSRIACSEDTSVLQCRHVETIRLSDEATEYFMSSIRDVEDPLAELMALLMIQKSVTKVDPALVLSIADGEGLAVDMRDALRICDDLLLSNFLAWTKAGYQVANRAIEERAKETGYLEPALASARRRIRRRF